MARKRMYSLYQKAENGRNWNRVSMLELTKPKAVMVFKSALIASCFEGWRELRLRPVKEREQIHELSKVRG